MTADGSQPEGGDLSRSPAGLSDGAKAGNRGQNVARKLKSDRMLFTATFLLVCVSVVMVFSASALVALERFDQADLFLIKQGLWAVLGLAVLAIVMRIDYRTYRSDTVVTGLLVFVGLLLVAVLFSPAVNGSRRWFGLGGLGIQPSELAKIACVLFTALMLERRMHRINEVSYSLLGIVIVCGMAFGLILLQPDLGTALSLAFIVGVMVFSAGLSYTYITVGAVIGIPAIIFLIWIEPYRWERVMSFLNPWADPLGHGFQLIQSEIAVGAGGLFGKGLMAGVQKLFYLPEPHTDFIYAVIGEELGLAGTLSVLGCFGFIAWRGLRIAEKAEDPFGSLLAMGVTTMIAAQAFINMSVVLGLLPTKGLPLPLISNGGSSLLVNMLGMGILLNISQHEAVDG
jgi:cell division protein FtsW